MRRIVRLAALLAAAAMLMSGCVFTRQESESIESIALPEPSPAPKNMILGERLPARSTSVTLYFARTDGASFTAVTRSLRAEPGESLLDAAVNALLTPGPVGQEMYFSTGDTRLLGCEFACGLATVNLSIDARNVQSEQELMSLVAAIGNTLLSIEGVKGVNVLIGDESERFSQLPLGVQTALIPSVTAAHAQLQAEREHFFAGDVPIERTAALYFPASEGGFLIPELRTLSFSGENFTETLIAALRDGPRAQRSAFTALPEDVDLLEAPRIITLTTGEHALVLNYSSTLANYLAFSGMELWQLAGSVALTLTSFVPEVDVVRILVNDEPITVMEIDGEIVRFPNGMVRRDDFAARIGSVATLYLPDEKGALHPVERAVARRAALSPRSLLEALFEYADPAGKLALPAPEGVSGVDILGIQVENGIALVNLSAGFYRACQTLDAAAERGLIYAIVNTLCRLNGISGVRFFIEGLSAETLSGSIYLKSALLPNPGIVVNPEDELITEVLLEMEE